MKQLLITIAAVVLVGCGNPEADRALLRAVSDESIDEFFKNLESNELNFNTR